MNALGSFAIAKKLLEESSPIVIKIMPNSIPENECTVQGIHTSAVDGHPVWFAAHDCVELVKIFKIPVTFKYGETEVVVSEKDTSVTVVAALNKRSSGKIVDIGDRRRPAVDSPSLIPLT